MLSSQGPWVSFIQNTLDSVEAVSVPVPLSCTQNLLLAGSHPTNAPSLGELGGSSAVGGTVRAGDVPGSPSFIIGWGVLARVDPKVTRQCQSPVILTGLLLPAAGGADFPAAPVQAEHGSPAGSKV